MKTTRFPLLILALAAALSPALEGTIRAATSILPFQGRLTDANGSSLPDGTRVVQFKIYDAPVGGIAVWGGEIHNLTINAGLVSTLLGTKAALSGVDFNHDLYLEMTIDANADGQISLADPPLLPRQSILPAVFARESANSQLLDGYNWSALFGTNNPADGTLLDSKIGNNTLTTAKIRDDAITTAKIANGAITRPKLDVTGALSGQSLMYDGSQVVWSQVNAVNAEKLKGFDWSAIFSGGDPQNGSLSVANLSSRGGLNVNGDSIISGRAFLNGASTTIQGTLFLVAIGGAPRMDGNLFVNDNGIYLRGVGDLNHFLRWGNALGNQSGFDGPVLVGNGGGALGTVGNWSLRWNSSGSVNVRTTLSQGSDRNIKENFTQVNPADVLAKVAALPITRWNYKDDPSAEHIGPVAQDFRAAFGLGSDDKSITTVDADGVALTAIQALNNKLNERDDEIKRLIRQQQEQIEALNAQIAALKAGRL
jgi:hypothetical protein